MKKISLFLLVAIFLIGLVYFSAEQIISLKMSSDLKGKFGDNYTILKMQIGGKPVEKVSLWRMLKTVYDYNFTKEHEPQGSAGLTGKHNYLALLISDNSVIYSCNWSFSVFKLDFPDYSIASWDIIENLPDGIAPLYRFDKKSRKKRGHLWFSDNFNNGEVRYYYRETKNLDTENKKNNDFSGEWFASDDSKGFSFNLELQQVGNKLTGKYTAIAMHGNRIDADPDAGSNIHGIINGNKADVVFSSFYGAGMGSRGSEVGKAVIIYDGEYLEWKIVEPPENGYYFCPDSVELRLETKPKKVFEKEGSIYYFDAEGKEKQLTFLGRDFEPVLHPNGKWIYFVRSFEGEMKGEVYYPKKGKEPKDGILKMELWRIDTSGDNAKMLYRNSTAAIDHPSGYAYAPIDNIQFSSEGGKVYFETSKWVTSAALNVMNSDGSNIKELGAGNATKIILSTGYENDEYKGYIVTNQHRYFVFGPSYDWWWLYDQDWNEIGPLGDTLEDMALDAEIKYTDGSEKEFAK